MWKILSTNLLTYNWYSSNSNLNRILSVPQKIDYAIKQIPDEDMSSAITTYGTAVRSDFIVNYVNYIPETPSSWEWQWDLDPESGISAMWDSETWWAIVECFYYEVAWPTEFTLVTLDSAQKTSVLNVYTNSVVPAMNSLWFIESTYKPDISWWISALLQWDNWKWYWMTAASRDWGVFYYVPFELDSDFSFIKIWTPGSAPTSGSSNYYNIIYLFWQYWPQSWAVSAVVDWVTTVNELWGYIAWLLWY